jgi:LuxR family transcriptional regulator, maltose regulon positive regulatory protein
VVVSSRADPPLRLHRYRLAGELAEIRASDLAFSTAEASLLMAQYRGTIRAPHSSASRGGLRAGRLAFASRRSPWTPIPTLTSSSRN